ncbi:uncharacterized protein LOC105284469 isoform X2 [Ooceraea biroi]|nr:uncharacterized protein LOC105284469 isoform X2 [Ooceraea biroi]XP_019888888.1 uncharacterized protein LOC105284469 isoform X2 [Ooceraea biroi]EZA49552.1 hypothetical protein X777_12097 [Ooceraea biroi]
MTELFILGHVSYGLSKRLNLTQLLIKENLVPDFYQYPLYDIPVRRDISYLPEEIYDVEDAAKQNKLQQLSRDNRGLIPEYRSLCETITRRVEIADTDYEYQPPHYHEVFCKNSLLDDDNEEIMKRALQQQCVHPGFHCVQKSRILFLARRHWESECWEPYTKKIASGCDCMWPVTTLGEIAQHY